MNVIYPKFKEQALQGGVNLASGNIKAVLVDLADYTRTCRIVTSGVRTLERGVNLYVKAP